MNTNHTGNKNNSYIFKMNTNHALDEYTSLLKMNKTHAKYESKYVSHE